MGFHVHDVKCVEDLFTSIDVSPSQARIVEFGSGRIRKDLKKQCPNGCRYVKDYYESLGALHVSFDTNGKGGTLKRDLRFPILDKEYVGKFDMLLNFGTAEHIGYQYGVWRNAHQLIRVGGGFFHTGPAFGRMRPHGMGLYDREFFIELSKLCGYRIVKLEFYPPSTYVHSKGLSYKYKLNFKCALVKEIDRPFPDIDTFYTAVDLHFHIFSRFQKGVEEWKIRGSVGWTGGS